MEIAELLRTRFVAMAIDNVENLNMTAAEKEFLRDRGLKFSTQGMSVFTAGGQVLGMGGGFEPTDVKQMLAKALEKYQPEESVAIPPRDEKDLALQRPPEGGLILYVSWKVLGGYDLSEATLVTKYEHYNKHMVDSVGVDRLWVRKDEAEALVQGTLPESLQKRLAWHLNYTMAGGERIQAYWAAGKLKNCAMSLHDGRLSGSFQTGSDDPGQMLGFVEAKDGKVTRFDLIAKGKGSWVEDCGFSACLRMVPKGKKVPVALLFSLADPKDDLARVPPHRAKHHGYLD